MRVLGLFIFIAAVHATSSFNGPCGGLLEADAGVYEFPPEKILEKGNVCVWIVKAISRQTVQFTLTKLGEGLTVNLYEEHSPTQSIEGIRLNSSDVGISVDNYGQTLIVVLTSNGCGQRFAFAWDSLAVKDPDLLTAANYINQDSGHVLWNRFSNREKLTLTLNTDQSLSLDVEVNADFRDCSLANRCQCSYVAIYEITSEGDLREVSVACDRPSQVKVQNLFANILAFVYLNSSHSVSAEDFAEIKWNVSESSVPSTSTSTTTEPPTSLVPIIISNECGGPVEVGRGSTVIEYLPPDGGSEMCVWTLVPTEAYSGFIIDYVSLGMEIGCDECNGVTTYNWNDDGVINSKRFVPNRSNSTIELTKPYAAIVLSAASVLMGYGFQVTITGTGNLEGEFNHQSFLLNQTQGTFSYPGDIGLLKYSPNERVTVVVQTSITKFTDVGVYYTDIQDDPLLVYELATYRNGGYVTLIGRTNGSNPEGVPSLFSSSRTARLFIFHSNNNSNTGNGFSITWKP